MSGPTIDLSQAERRALRAMAQREWMTPAEIGHAMTVGREWPLKDQGAGRVGGGMAKRLIAKGMVMDVSFKRQGFPAYRITQDGRRAAFGEDGSR